MSADEEQQYPNATERLKALPEPPTAEIRNIARREKLFVILAALALSLGLIGFAVAWGARDEASNRADRNAEAAATAQDTANKAGAQASTAVEAANEANRRLKAAGKPTVPVPTITPAAPPPTVVVEGLSGSQESAVRAIVAGQLAAYQPTIPPAAIQQIATLAASLVPKPKDGHTPTAAELQPLVAAAQATYCASGRCEGKPGTPGVPGANGTPGADGKDAPPVTAEQLQPLVAAGITAYCGQESKPCEGQPGSPGKDAPPPYSVTDMDCVGDGNDSSWVIYLNNGVGPQITKTAKGPCRIGPESPPVALRTR